MPKRLPDLPAPRIHVIERAGFIEAPQIGPANMASKATTAPMASPAVIPFSRAPVETRKITNISKKVSTTSNTNDW